MRRQTNSQKHFITKKKRIRLKKSIREGVVVTLVGLIGAVVLVAMFFGAAIQEQDKLAVMAAAEVER